MKEATKDEPVAVVDIDLNKQKLWPWLGDFKNRIPSEMPPQKAIQNKTDKLSQPLASDDSIR